MPCLISSRTAGPPSPTGRLAKDYTILFFAILYYAMLCYAMLFYTLLY